MENIRDKRKVYKRPLRRTKVDCWGKKRGRERKSPPIPFKMILVKSLEIFNLTGIKPLKQMEE